MIDFTRKSEINYTFPFLNRLEINNSKLEFKVYHKSTNYYF